MFKFSPSNTRSKPVQNTLHLFTKKANNDGSELNDTKH